MVNAHTDTLNENDCPTAAIFLVTMFVQRSNLKSGKWMANSHCYKKSCPAVSVYG